MADTPAPAAGAPVVSLPTAALSASQDTTTAGARTQVRQATLPPAAPQVTALPAKPVTGQTTASRQLASSGIPARARNAYTTAAAQITTAAPTCHLSWALLAAIGRVESNHGRAAGSTLNTRSGRATPPIYGPRLDGTTPGLSTVRDTDRGALDADPTYDRAVGPMQFLPSTWRTFATDGDGDRIADPQDIDDATVTAARYLCTTTDNLSTTTGQWNAAYRYNHSISYANLVLALTTTYTTGKPATVVNPPTGATTSPPTITITITPPTTTTSTTTSTSTSTTSSSSTTTTPPVTSTITPTVTITATTITVTVGNATSTSTTTQPPQSSSTSTSTAK
jgi:membrane-bound lytic murein transglycosylase B